VTMAMKCDFSPREPSEQRTLNSLFISQCVSSAFTTSGIGLSTKPRNLLNQSVMSHRPHSSDRRCSPPSHLPSIFKLTREKSWGFSVLRLSFEGKVK
jgi:hypothetical protein